METQQRLSTEAVKRNRLPVIAETAHAGGFLVWEALRDYCRETVTLAAGKLQPGAVLGRITASGKYAANDPATSDGAETAARVVERRRRKWL